MAGQVVDEFITRYTLDSSQYEAGAKAVLDATQLASRAANQAHPQIQAVGSAFQSAAAQVPLVGGPLSAVAGGLTSVAQQAVNAVSGVSSFVGKAMSSVASHQAVAASAAVAAGANAALATSSNIAASAVTSIAPASAVASAGLSTATASTAALDAATAPLTAVLLPLEAALLAVGAAAAALAGSLLAVMGTYGAVAGLAMKTIPEFAKEDTLERSFEGFLGSAEKAAQMIAYLKQEARGNPFHFSGLAETAQGLTAMSMDVNRFLPQIEKLAGGMGHLSDQGLQDVLEIFRQLRGGETARALGPRGLGRFGISHDDLKKYGAQFNGDEFVGSTNQAFDAVERLIESRFGKVYQQMRGGAEAVISDMADALHQAEVQIGAGLSEVLLPVVRNLTEAVRSLTESGDLKIVADTIGKILMPQGTGVDSIKAIIREILLDCIQWVQVMSTVGKVLSHVADGFVFIGKVISSTIKFIPGLGMAMGIVLDQFNALVGNKWAMDKVGLNDPLGLDARKAASEQIMKAEKKYAAEDHSKKVTAPVPNGSGATANSPVLSAIEVNTRKTAEALDLRRFAVGGGEIGRMGISQSEIAGRARGIAGASSHSVNALVDALGQVIGEAMGSASADGMRSGMMIRRTS